MSRNRALLLALFVLSASLSRDHLAVADPSFSCKAASTAVELLICDSPLLSSQDSTLADTYAAVRRDVPQDKSLPPAQRLWLKSRAAVCLLPGNQLPPGDFERFRAAVCLFGMYSKRKAALDQLMFREQEDDQITWADEVKEEKQRYRIIDHFGEFLPGFDRTGAQANIGACAHVLVIQFGKYGQNVSYGASCKVDMNERSMSVLLCDDKMIGKFHIAEGSDKTSRDDLVKFVKDTCPS